MFSFHCFHCVLTSAHMTSLGWRERYRRSWRVTCFLAARTHFPLPRNRIPKYFDIFMDENESPVIEVVMYLLNYNGEERIFFSLCLPFHIEQEHTTKHGLWKCLEGPLHAHKSLKCFLNFIIRIQIQFKPCIFLFFPHLKERKNRLSEIWLLFSCSVVFVIGFFCSFGRNEKESTCIEPVARIMHIINT